MKQGDYQTDKQAKGYHDYRFAGGLYLVHKYEAEIISSWVKSIEMPENSIIADIGTGTGRIIKELTEFYPKRIYAVDISLAMLEQLSRNFKKEVVSGLIKTIISSSSNIPLKKNSVDLAISLHLFKHLSNPKPSIISISKILKQKGYFIFDLLNINSIVRFNLQTCYAYSFSVVKSMLEEEGFEIKNVMYLNNFGETIYSITGSIANVVYLLDKMITKANVKLGVKMLILAQKI